MNRRTFLKNVAGSLLALTGLAGGGYYYAREMEPYMLQKVTETVVSKRIPVAYDNFNIIQFSDTHLGFHYTLEQFSELVHKINANNPDLIVFTGDLVDNPSTYHWSKELTKQLQTLQARYGKYWIYGNHDHGGYGTEKVKHVMDQSGFQLLKNTHTVLDKDGAQIVLAGIDDVILGRPNLDKALKNADENLYTILLAHEPDYADTTTQHAVDLQLSGHSHGGQVRVPFWGHLYTPAYAEKYIDGRYILGDGRLVLLVSTGVGTTRLPYRFLCKPEINQIILKRG